MSMKKMLAVVAAASLVAVAAPAFAANPFSDVPMNHWAYDAVEQLSAKGILEGYPNGTFKGNRAMTRYEIATMVARMMAAGGLSGEDLEKLKALVVEFQPELEALGVKVDGFDSRLSALEKGLGGWKITGQMRFDYNAWDNDGAATGAGADGFTMNRARLFLHRDLSDGVSFDARWHRGNFDRWWVTAKDFMGLEGLTMRGGQFYLDWEDEDGLYDDNDAFNMDANYRGFDLKYNRGMFTVEGFAASNQGGNIYAANASDEYYGARLKFDFSEKFWLSLNGLWYNVGDTNYKTYWAGLGFSFMDGLELKGAYYMEDIDGAAIDDPKAFKVILDVDQDVLKFTSLWVEYAKLDQGFYIDRSPWSFSDVLWPGDISAGVTLPDDVDVLFVKAKQKWNDKWSTIERYVKYDIDTFWDAKEWSVAIGYQYSPNLYFELAYADMDGSFFDPNYDNNQIRFRTLLNF
ncbi:S-layer homology domain-containing protein [Pyramidobacter sp. CG50-2]|uniref:S-layer homology domain-containing protein n=1 Tax=Pyramidobacter sp. CG50-2 TaxID=2382160 RepID=UPI000EA01EBA|nr:S-layer homology domain-containing protein [Pyramidobacter sp. CG50-2]RKJ81689.1 S-layer homology domain-containing protein [Pyramidobacter sp. CG50-2]